MIFEFLVFFIFCSLVVRFGLFLFGCFGGRGKGCLACLFWLLGVCLALTFDLCG